MIRVPPRYERRGAEESSQNLSLRSTNRWNGHHHETAEYHSTVCSTLLQKMRDSSAVEEVLLLYDRLRVWVLERVGSPPPPPRILYSKLDAYTGRVPSERHAPPVLNTLLIIPYLHHVDWGGPLQPLHLQYCSYCISILVYDSMDPATRNLFSEQALL